MATSPWRRVRSVLVVGALAVGGAGLVAVSPASAATGCRVDYVVASQWGGGFVANLTITNLGDAINGWTLTWTFPNDQRITNGWNATFGQSGAAVSATNAGYNGALSTGGSTSAGFQGTFGSTNGVPPAFALNGVACTGSTGGSTTTTTSTSTSTTSRTTTTSTTSRTTTTTTTTTTPPGRIRGGDISTLAKNEDKGAVYYDENGTRGDAITILKAHGMNWARLKVWVNPADGYNNKARVLAMAKRIKAQGLGLLIDFHYSDSWADPGKQVKPAAWANYNFAQLRQAVYDHTYDVLNGLKAQGTTADMVQVGNEINPGMLLPDGSINNWPQLAQLLNSGSRAVKDVNSSTRVMIHRAEGGDNSAFRWFYDSLAANGVSYDVIGLSFYPYWHGSMSALRTNVNDLATRYNKDLVVVETAYGFTTAEKDSEPNIFNSSLASAGGYPATPAGQASEFRDVIAVMNQVPNGRGLGVFYWEPAWTAVSGAGWDPTNPNSGNGWENQALFDYNSRALPAMSAFGS